MLIIFHPDPVVSKLVDIRDFQFLGYILLSPLAVWFAIWRVVCDPRVIFLLDRGPCHPWQGKSLGGSEFYSKFAQQVVGKRNQRGRMPDECGPCYNRNFLYLCSRYWLPQIGCHNFQNNSNSYGKSHFVC